MMKVSNLTPQYFFKLIEKNHPLKKYLRMSGLAISTLFLYDYFYGNQRVKNFFLNRCIKVLYPPIPIRDFSHERLKALAEESGGYEALVKRGEFSLEDLFEEKEKVKEVARVIMSVLYKRRWPPTKSRYLFNPSVGEHAYGCIRGVHNGQDEQVTRGLLEIITTCFPILKDLSKSGLLNIQLIRTASLVYKYLSKPIKSKSNELSKECNKLKFIQSLFSKNRPPVYDFIEIAITIVFFAILIKMKSRKISSEEFLYTFPPTAPFQLTNTHENSHEIPIEAAEEIENFVNNDEEDTLFCSSKEGHSLVDSLLSSDRNSRIINSSWFKTAGNFFTLDFRKLDDKELYNPDNMRKWEKIISQLIQQAKLSTKPVFVLYRKNLQELLDKSSDKVNEHFIKLFYDALTSFKDSVKPGKVIIVSEGETLSGIEIEEVFSIDKYPSIWGKYKCIHKEKLELKEKLQKILRQDLFKPHVPSEAWNKGKRQG